jgi:hypothetical protein
MARTSICEYAGFLNFIQLVERPSVRFLRPLVHNVLEIDGARSLIQIASALHDRVEVATEASIRSAAALDTG